MKVDLHTHSLASGHAYNTILEIAKDAADKNLEAVAITDHGPALGFVQYPNYFHVLRRIPDELFGVRILKGCEANVLDTEGTIDIGEKVQRRLDLVIAGLHVIPGFPRDLGPEGNTAALVKAIDKNRIHIISHPFRPGFPVNIKKLFSACQARHVLLEINLSVLRDELDNEMVVANTKELVDLALENKAKLVINSDAHFISEVADDSILKELSFKVPPEIVLGVGGYEEVAEFLADK